MEAKTVQKRLLAAEDLLRRRAIDASALASLRTLLSGIDPRLDKALAAASTAAKKVDNLQKGEVISFAIDSLPEFSPEDKKRKKAILFFLNCWKDLQSEVARVEKELENSSKDQSLQGKAGMLGNIFGATKGPLGLITLGAVVIAGLKMTETTVVIQNKGCEPIRPPTGIALNIPGLKLPNQVIGTSGEAIVKLPPLRARVDMTDVSRVRLSIAGMKYDFDMSSSRMQFIYDGTLLNGSSSDVNLGTKKQHVLVVQCQ